MTYEELLEKLNDKYIVFTEPDSVFNFYKKQSDALRAVVEEHKPIEKVWTDKTTDIFCGSCGDVAYIPYPCRTIEAIQKELS